MADSEWAVFYSSVMDTRIEVILLVWPSKPRYDRIGIAPNVAMGFGLLEKSP